MSRFFHQTKWWEMKPCPDMVFNYAPRLCLARSGYEYIVYLRWGSRVTVDIGKYNYDFEYCFFDPRTGRYTDRKPVTGKGKIDFFLSPSYFPEKKPDDWVLYITRIQ
ncbi:putative collagen-binding domain-containing protein [Bacteroidota bacterium]